MIVPLSAADARTCGAKAAALGTLLRAGLPVPDGFVVPFDAYQRLSPELIESLRRGLDALGATPVAVRSSAAGEDTATTSAAGQHESALAVQGIDAVLSAIQDCWASLHSRRAVDYRDALGQARDPAMAVLVQRHVDADVSGVMFTPADPDGAIHVEASWGLGPSVVGGTVTPDSYRVAPDGSVTHTVGDKRTRLDRRDAHLVTRDVPIDRRNRPSIDDLTAVRLAELGHRVAALLGGAQDIEWAIVDDRIWLLQARPVTAAPPPRSGGLVAGTLTGTPGSHGVATGVARIVGDADGFGRVRPGDILVCPYTDPAWTPLLRIAAGVVTDIGGALSHAAIVAREYRIPAVLGVANATTTLPDGATITIDGSAGTITIH